MQTVNQTYALMKKIPALLAFALVAFTANAQSYLNGDMNHDGDKNITDVVLLVDEILHGPKSEGFLTCPDGHHPHVIDLGLPSGTKWACCNVDASAPEGYGGYYAWGETKEKNIYDWSTYIHCDGDKESCLHLGGNIAGTPYDVAHLKMGSAWQMPSPDQGEELLDYCTPEWTTVNGVNGIMFTGPNGGSIFLPATGIRINNELRESGDFGYYWMSTHYPSPSYFAFYFFIGPYGTHSFWGNTSRSSGMCVRPVFVENAQRPLVLSASKVKVYDGESTTVEIASGSGSYMIGCSDKKVATASLSGTTISITGVAAGSTVVSVTDATTGNSQFVNVTVVAKEKSYLACPDAHHPHLIDLGMPSGTKWACCNVGADKPESYGGYYAWGETEEKDVYTVDNYLYYDSSSKTYLDLGDIAGTQYDVAHMNWSGSWQMPNIDQIQELLIYCSNEWTTLNGVYGLKCTGLNGGAIFLPAAGFRKYENFGDVGNYGNYWSTTTNPEDLKQIMSIYFSSLSSMWYYARSRWMGYSVRPISK